MPMVRSEDSLPQELAEFPVIVTIAVAWGDMDALGHVNNTMFFRYFETVRIAYFDRLEVGTLMRTQGVGPILAETRCRFRRPLTYPDTLDVGARVAEVGTDRYRMEMRIWSRTQQTVAADGDGLIVSYDYGAARKAPLPHGVREAIKRLQG